MANPEAKIQYEIPNPSRVKISVYNISGRKVLDRDLGPMEAGYHSYTLKPSGWSSGTYIIQVEALGAILTQRITYLK